VDVQVCAERLYDFSRFPTQGGVVDYPDAEVRVVLDGQAVKAPTQVVRSLAGTDDHGAPRSPGDELSVGATEDRTASRARGITDRVTIRFPCVDFEELRQMGQPPIQH
jgi:hypothetical protein